MSRLRSLPARWLPPALRQAVPAARDNEYEGSYASWGEAASLCTGYGEPSILEKTRAALLIQVPPPGKAHPFWSGRPWSTRRARAWARLNSILRKTRLHRLISRALDLLGYGDNQLLMLRKPD